MQTLDGFAQLKVTRNKIVSHASPHQLTATEVIAAGQSGDLTPATYLLACIDRIETRDAAVKAFSYFDGNDVRLKARILKEVAVGPLHGIPVAVKDVFDTSDQPTGMGSPIYEGNRPFVDASTVRLLRDAGAVIIGKTATSEFASLGVPATCNPLDLARTAGASSSGSAAAVGDFMVPLALATQTGGSTLRPASYCGVIGFKPSFGRVSRAGVKENAHSLDTVGWMARSVKDIALLDNVLTSSGVSKLIGRLPNHIAVCKTPLWHRAKPETHQAIANACRALEGIGVRVTELVLPVAYEKVEPTRRLINEYERARALADEWSSWPELISQPLRESIQRGMRTTLRDYTNALKFADHLRQQLLSLMQDVDCVLAPCVDGEAPFHEQGSGDTSFQAFWTLMHTPTIGLPLYAGPNGLPVSIQLIGHLYEDETLLTHADAVWESLRTRSMPPTV